MPPRKVLTDAWTAFENIFKGDVTRVANGHGIVHLLRLNKESDCVLPIKIEAERDGGFSSWDRCVYSGILVRYFQNGDTMLCTSTETLSNRVRRLRRDNADRLVPPETLKKQILQTVENDQTLLVERTTAQHRHSHGAERFGLEALGQSELAHNITKGCYKVTPEFCPADAAYAPDPQSFTVECLPIQVKTANVSKAKTLSSSSAAQAATQECCCCAAPCIQVRQRHWLFQEIWRPPLLGTITRKVQSGGLSWSKIATWKDSCPMCLLR